MIKQMKKIGNATLYCADCKDVLPLLKDIDACVTDPPYGLSFMGKAWDYDVPGTDIWTRVHDVLKPGGHLLSFFGSRTYHRGVIPIEDAGFEIRDQLMWIYGSGFPKSLDVSKAITKTTGIKTIILIKKWLLVEINKCTKSIAKINAECAFSASSYTKHTDGNDRAGRDTWHLLLPNPTKWKIMRDVIGFSDTWDMEIEQLYNIKHKSTAALKSNPEIYGTYSGEETDYNLTPKAKQWEGWGTALKPAHEPIVMARKPFKGTVANNVLEHGTGGINIDGCRVGTDESLSGGSGRIGGFAGKTQGGELSDYKVLGNEQGRFPANVMHDGSESVQDVFGDKSRYFYCAKASKKDRDEGLDMIDEKAMAWGNQAKADGDSTKHNQVQMRKNTHPTVKPTELMRYLCRLVTPKGGVIVDPFMGSGSTGKAAIAEGFGFVGIEMDEDYFEIACARIEAAHKQKSQELF
tara:strand:- start:1239 stop:2627 length:1389 start_codon:yes stop_codon:yes gene_type:complete